MNHCKYCHSTENLTIDHKIPIVQGGTDELSNLQCLCKGCNQMKSGVSHNQVKNLWRWYEEINQSRKEKGKKPYYCGIKIDK